MARPKWVAGAEHLDWLIRWVHISESHDLASVLHGRELLLTEGRMFQASPADSSAIIAELKLAALIIELGHHIPSVPRHMIEESQAGTCRWSRYTFSWRSSTSPSNSYPDHQPEDRVARHSAGSPTSVDQPRTVRGRDRRGLSLN
ncbi:PucR family transcriptional regulator ligand-binding domain-containing protein [Rhodococcus jostii]|uniref:PucR family transcriptional regulator ligand-binding domain-containing protein n=1 Tax=Rhodococcus jostii TaxID=132919 RepID=UPI00398299A0